MTAEKMGQVRRELCRRRNCDRLDKVNYDDPYAACPNGHWKCYPGRLGDKISAIATPIARALKMPCVDPKTGQLRPESGCAKMKARLNAGMPVKEALMKRIKGE